jgi:drug/metabolite transporter (DMT)-like permease
MNKDNRDAILALAAAGVLWGLTVPLSKLALAWLGPAWLTVARFAGASIPLAVAGRRRLRETLDPRVAASGAIGLGAMIITQNAGIERTSVSHAALIVGAVPVLVALIALGAGEPLSRRTAWSGHLLALAGIALVAGAGGGGATLTGDLLVLASAMLAAAFIVVQPRVLAGRNPAAVSAVQLAAGAIGATPVAALTEGAPLRSTPAGPMLAVLALTVAGTLLPFWLWAFGQAHVPAQIAGSFVNLEPLVGAATGWLAFGEAAAIVQVAGAIAILAGIALSTLPQPRAPEAPPDVVRSPPTAGYRSARRTARQRHRRQKLVADSQQGGRERSSHLQAPPTRRCRITPTLADGADRCRSHSLLPPDLRPPVRGREKSATPL